MGSLRKLSVLALQYYRLNGSIPVTLGNLGMLRRLDLSFNQLSGSIPASLANISLLEVLDVQNNTLSGIAPPALKRLNGGFHTKNNPGLCVVGFLSLRVCTAWDDLNIVQVQSFEPIANNTAAPNGIPMSANFQAHCNQTHCSSSSKFRQVIVAGVTTVMVTLMIAGFLIFIRHQRQKQKIRNTFDASDGWPSTDQAKEFYSKTASPLVILEYSNGWDPLADSHDGNGLSQEFPPGFKFNLEDVESATQYFSEVNLLGKSNFSAVYKGILEDGSIAAIRSINVTCSKLEKAEFMKGLYLLTSLRHENLVRLRGFCFSKGRGECFLIYDFASKGNLSQYLDVEDGSGHFLDWPTRVSIINGIAKGISYLHSNESSKPSIVHQNISVEKVLIDEKLDPLISDCGLLKLLADDCVFSCS